MNLDDYRQLVLQCKCGHNSEIYYGLFQNEKGELFALWRCGRCQIDCMAILAGIKPTLEFFSKEDEKFLKSCNIGSVCEL